jgi:hypothetical protein
MEVFPMSQPTIKDEALKLVEQLPDDATWEDLMYSIYVRQTIEKGLQDSRAGRLTSHEDIKAQYGLPE